MYYEYIVQCAIIIHNVNILHNSNTPLLGHSHKLCSFPCLLPCFFACVLFCDQIHSWMNPGCCKDESNTFGTVIWVDEEPYWHKVTATLKYNYRIISLMAHGPSRVDVFQIYYNYEYINMLNEHKSIHQYYKSKLTSRT